MTDIDLNWAAFDQARGKHPRQPGMTPQQIAARNAQTQPVIPLSPAAQAQVRKIQKEGGLPETGQLDPATIAYTKKAYNTAATSGSKKAKKSGSSSSSKKSAKSQAAKEKAAQKKAAAKAAKLAKAKALAHYKQVKYEQHARRQQGRDAVTRAQQAKESLATGIASEKASAAAAQAAKVAHDTTPVRTTKSGKGVVLAKGVNTGSLGRRNSSTGAKISTRQTSRPSKIRTAKAISSARAKKGTSESRAKNTGPFGKSSANKVSKLLKKSKKTHSLSEASPRKKAGKRTADLSHVRTEAGVKKYHEPIGSLIIAHPKLSAFTSAPKGSKVKLNGLTWTKGENSDDFPWSDGGGGKTTSGLLFKQKATNLVLPPKVDDVKLGSNKLGEPSGINPAAYHVAKDYSITQLSSMPEGTKLKFGASVFTKNGQDKGGWTSSTGTFWSSNELSGNGSAVMVEPDAGAVDEDAVASALGHKSVGQVVLNYDDVKALPVGSKVHSDYTANSAYTKKNEFEWKNDASGKDLGQKLFANGLGNKYNAYVIDHIGVGVKMPMGSGKAKVPLVGTLDKSTVLKALLSAPDGAKLELPFGTTASHTKKDGEWVSSYDGTPFDSTVIANDLATMKSIKEITIDGKKYVKSGNAPKANFIETGSLDNIKKQLDTLPIGTHVKSDKGSVAWTKTLKTEGDVQTVTWLPDNGVAPWTPLENVINGSSVDSFTGNPVHWRIVPDGYDKTEVKPENLTGDPATKFHNAVVGSTIYIDGSEFKKSVGNTWVDDEGSVYSSDQLKKQAPNALVWGPDATAANLKNNASDNLPKSNGGSDEKLTPFDKAVEPIEGSKQLDQSDFTNAENDVMDKSPNFDVGQVGEYTGSWAGVVNGQLRGMSPGDDLPGGVKELDDSMSPFKQNVTLYRGVPASVIPGVDANADGYTQQKQIQAYIDSGEILHDAGYMSTAYDTTPGIVRGARAILKIQVPKGTKALYAQPYSGFEDENEILLSRDNYLKVTRVEPVKSGGTIHFIIETELIPSPKEAA